MQLINFAYTLGNGGRPWVANSWKVTYRKGNSTITATSVQNILNRPMAGPGSLSGIVSIPGKMLNFTSYTFTLYLVNWLGGSNVQSAVVTKSAVGNIPTVNILGDIFFKIMKYYFFEYQ